jgi:hypothetical protein
LQKILGRSTPTIAARYYIHLSRQSIADALKEALL